MKSDIRKIAMGLALLIAAAIAVLSLMPGGSAPPVPGSDKVKHFIAYAVLAAPLAFSFGSRAKWRAFALALAYGVFMEFAQWAAPTGREASVLDAIADALGAGLGVGIGLVALKYYSAATTVSGSSSGTS
ncbi:MAG: VanZ family protein [Hyphomonadaceae bacterium]